MTLKTLTILFILATIAISCKKENEKDVPVDVTEQYVKNANYVFTYQTKGDIVIFDFDILSDQSQGLDGEWPDIDTYQLFVDYNHNGKVDDGVDLMFSPNADGDICVAELIDQSSTADCSYSEEVSGSSSFGISENATVPHTRFAVSIPKHLLSNDDWASITIYLYDSETGWQYLPSSGPIFKVHYGIFW